MEKEPNISNKTEKQEIRGMNKKMVRLSKFLSFVLRHGAKEVGISMGTDGFVSLSELLKLKQSKDFSEGEIQFVVDNNDKKRFEIKVDGDQKFIRAVQGHTIKEVKDEELLEPIHNASEIPFIVHGTESKAWTQFIRFQGLKRMARNHVHFAIGFNEDTGVISGMRNSGDVIIELDVALAMADGFTFFRSSNNVILCGGKGNQGCIPPCYFKNVWTKPKNGKKEALDMTPYDYILVLDFEANGIEEGSLECQEIIEFPVVPVDRKTGKVLVDKIFHYYVKPTVVPQITQFGTGLTKITQAQVDQGTPLIEVLGLLDKWMTDNGFNAENSTFSTGGRWDLNTCLKKEADYKKIDLKSYLKKFINVKDVWQAVMFESKATGMPGMLSSLELELEGTHHSGIDDSKNIAKIVIALLERQGGFTKLQEIFVK